MISQQDLKYFNRRIANLHGKMVVSYELAIILSPQQLNHLHIMKKEEWNRVNQELIEREGWCFYDIEDAKLVIQMEKEKEKLFA